MIYKTIGEACEMIKGETGIMKAIPGKFPLVTTGPDRKSCNSFQFDTEAVCIPLVSSTGHGHKSLNYVHYQSGKFALGTILVAVIPKNKNELSAEFLQRYLFFFKDTLLVPLMKGAANVTLGVRSIAKIEIPIPSLQKQKKFIELINKVEIKHNQILSEFENQSFYLTQLRQTILQEAIEGKLTADWRKENPVRKGEPDYDAQALLKNIKTEKEKLVKEGKIKKQKPLAPIKQDEVPFELPEGWVWTRMGEISQVFAGYSFNSSDFKSENEAKCIKITNAGVQQLIESEERLPSDFITKYKEFLVKTNDLIIALTRPYISTGLKISRCPESFNNALLNQRVAAIRNYFSLNWNYIFQFMTSDFVLNGYKEKFEKVNLQPNLKMSDVTELHIPLPPLAEQQAIVDRVVNLLSMVDELEKQVSERKEQSIQLMQAVLREAFEGQA